MLPKIGEKYKASGPLIERNSRIRANSEWILVCDQAFNISLSLYANNLGGADSITIATSFFGNNFKKIQELGTIDRARTYTQEKHYYPNVSVKGPIILPA